MDNPIAEAVIYRQRERFKENTRHEITYELDQSFHTPIQVRAPRSARPRTEHPPPRSRGRSDRRQYSLGDARTRRESRSRARCIRHSGPHALGNAQVLIDGDLSTRWFVRRTIQAERDVFSHIVLDLGATYFIDKLKIVGAWLPGPAAASPLAAAKSLTSSSPGAPLFNFYEVLGSDGSVAPDGTLIWQKYYSGTATRHVKEVTGAATHEFGLVPTRFIRVLWKSWDASNRWAFRALPRSFRCLARASRRIWNFART